MPRWGRPRGQGDRSCRWVQVGCSCLIVLSVFVVGAQFRRGDWAARRMNDVGARRPVIVEKLDRGVAVGAPQAPVAKAVRVKARTEQLASGTRSEERRVGKECRGRGGAR